MHGVDAVDRRTVGADDPVSDADIGGYGGAVLLASDDLEGAADLQIETSYQASFERPVPSRNSEIGPAYMPIGEYLGEYPLGRAKQGTGHGFRSKAVCDKG